MKGTVQFNGSCSECFDIPSRVKQGCVLAQTPFGIFFVLLLRHAFSTGTDSHHVTMETIAEWNTVRNLIAERVNGDTSNHHWYIGLRNVSGTWTWTEEPEGVTQGTVAEDDMRWETDEPSIRYSELCAEIHSNYRGQQGHFNNVKCYERPSRFFHRGHICEREYYVE